MSDLREDFVDISSLLSSSQSKLVQSALKQRGSVLAVRLHGFNGLLKRELMLGVRLGTEMAKRAVFWGRVGGIVHSDELPNYGIERDDVDSINKRLECGEIDAFVVIADDKENALDGLRAVVERAREAVVLVPEETRAANADGTTSYMRPRPGAARMYPETDVPPVQISVDRVGRIAKNLPRMPEEIAREIESKYDLGSKLAGQLVSSDYLKTFDVIMANSKNVAASFVATVLTESLRGLGREQVPVENIGDQQLKEVFQLVADGLTAKESVVDILKWMALHPESTAREALDKLNLRMLTRGDLESIVTKILESNRSFVRENGSKALGRIMNLVMGEVRGRADPRLVNELLRSGLARIQG